MIPSKSSQRMSPSVILTLSIEDQLENAGRRKEKRGKSNKRPAFVVLLDKRLDDDKEFPKSLA